MLMHGLSRRAEGCPDAGGWFAFNRWHTIRGMTEPGMEGIAFEAVTLLPGLAALVKRSGDLEGNLPVRAARYCGPVFEGSAAGFQVTLGQPMTLKRDRRGRVGWDLTPPVLRLITDEVPDAVERGAREGLIDPKSPWWRLFRRDPLPVRGNRALVWTGLVVRPRPGLWLVVGGAFNRRSRINVVDHVVSDHERFVPLVVEIDVRDVGRKASWMEGEIACVTPVAPRVRIRKERLEAGAPELKAFAAFFSEAYFETKAQHPTASYVRRTRDRRVKAAETCEARLLFAGPDVHAIREFKRFITEAGFAGKPRSPGILQFALVRHIARLRWTWQGQTHSSFEVRQQRLLPALEALWKATVGDTATSGLEFLANYALGEHWDQPYVQVQPWVFLPTPDGWSTLVDGAHHPPELDGMRAVIATDWFHALAMVLRLFGPGEVDLAPRSPLLRALPVSRPVLDLGVKEATLAPVTPTESGP